MKTAAVRSAAITIAAALIAGAALGACSIRQAAFNSVSDMLAPVPSARASAKPAGGTDPMTALTGENDPELVAGFFPAALKIYEMLMLQNPSHRGLRLMTGQLYVTYANAFVQSPAQMLPGERYDEQNGAYLRAANLYARGSDYAVDALDLRYRNFRSSVFGTDSTARGAALSRCRKDDVSALYWAGSGALGAFSISPLDTRLLERLPGAVALLERAAELDPGYGEGGLQTVLMSFYAAAPESLGGGMDKALTARDLALRYAAGKSPSTFIACARAFAIPSQDSASFDAWIGQALAVDPESRPENRLALTIAHREAVWLASHKADFILE